MPPPRIVNNSKGFGGFTLAEILITLTILGVVAALTVPSIVHNNQTRINKTRLKKAMATYDRAISQMSAVNRLNNKVLFKQWAEENYCDNAVSYFNIVNSTRNGCKFKTSDGIWWDVTNIDRTLVSFKEENLTSQKAKNYDDKDAFVLVASFDDSQGVLRIDDLGYETNNPIDFSNVFVAKLYEFISRISSDISKFDICKAMSADTCTITVGGKEYIYQKKRLTDKEICTDKNGNNLSVYDSETGTTKNNYCSKSTVKDIYALSRTSLTYQEAVNFCSSQGTRLANIAEIKSLNVVTNSLHYWALEKKNNTSAYRVFWKRGDIDALTTTTTNKQSVLCVSE